MWKNRLRDAHEIFRWASTLRVTSATRGCARRRRMTASAASRRELRRTRESDGVKLGKLGVYDCRQNPWRSPALEQVSPGAELRRRERRAPPSTGWS